MALPLLPVWLQNGSLVLVYRFPLEYSGKSVDAIFAPRTDKLFLGQLHAIKNHDTEQGEDFKQGLSNFYSIQNLIYKFSTADVEIDRKIVTHIEDLSYQLGTLLTKPILYRVLR